MGYTLTLEVPEGIYKPLVKAAEQAGRTPEDLAGEWLIIAVRAAIEDPVENFIGAFRSNNPDWAEQHDKYIGHTLMAEMQGIEDKGS